MFKLSDLLLNPRKAKRHPLEIFLLAFFYTTISLFLSLWVFPEHAALATIFLTTIACLYISEGVLLLEEKKEKNTTSEKSLIRNHSHVLLFFLSLFLGFLVASAFWTITLSPQTVSQAFDLQADTLKTIQAITGNATSLGTFETILSNNLRVFLLAVVFALFYGAGAIFILAWNASLMGFVIGSIAKNSLGLSALPLITFKYFLHGIPEMLAYFAAALAGGILFISLIKGDVKKGRAKRTLLDFFITLLLAIALLVVAALIEVYISPII